MASRKTADIAAALLQKGFRQDDRDHEFLFLYVGDRKTSVYTKLSRGFSDYGDTLLGKVQKQLRMAGRKRQFNALLDCPMTGEQYLKYLVDHGEVRL